jgi:hypothetical protein
MKTTTETDRLEIDSQRKDGDAGEILELTLDDLSYVAGGYFWIKDSFAA